MNDKPSLEIDTKKMLNAIDAIDEQKIFFRSITEGLGFSKQKKNQAITINTQKRQQLEEVKTTPKEKKENILYERAGSDKVFFGWLLDLIVVALFSFCSCFFFLKLALKSSTLFEGEVALFVLFFFSSSYLLYYTLATKIFSKTLGDKFFKLKFLKNINKKPSFF